MDKKLNILTGEFTKIIIETDEDCPITIATITNDSIEPANGYRVRMTPQFN